MGYAEERTGLNLAAETRLGNGGKIDLEELKGRWWGRKQAGAGQKSNHKRPDGGGGPVVVTTPTQKVDGNLAVLPQKVLNARSWLQEADGGKGDNGALFLS